MHCITICMGSSCFSRGNKKTVTQLREYLKENKLEDRVTLKGDHCMGECCHGPVVKIDEEVIHSAQEAQIESYLEDIAGK
jgi:NADH:ubiquinone oxidoreductase subunit E